MHDGNEPTKAPAAIEVEADQVLWIPRDNMGALYDGKVMRIEGPGIAEGEQRTVIAVEHGSDGARGVLCVLSQMSGIGTVLAPVGPGLTRDIGEAP